MLKANVKVGSIAEGEKVIGHRRLLHDTAIRRTPRMVSEALLPNKTYSPTTKHSSQLSVRQTHGCFEGCVGIVSRGGGGITKLSSELGVTFQTHPTHSTQTGAK